MTELQPRLRLWMLAVLAVTWTASLGLATASASRPQRSWAAYLSSAAVYAAGALVCHQRPERSFFFRGAQMPVCARCIGLYVGGAVAALVLAIRGVRHRWSASSIRWVLVCAAVPTAVTLLYELAAGETPANPVRALAGLPLGASIAWAIGMVSASRTSLEVN